MTDERPIWQNPWLVWAGLFVIAVAGLLRRLVGGHVPGDLTAYLHAADMFAAGLDVYSSARFEMPRYGGFPYNYAPGTLYLIAPLSWLSSTVAASLDWIARLAALALMVRVLARDLFDIKPAWIALAAVMLEPLAVDLLRSNLVTYLLAAFVWVVSVSRRDANPRDFAMLFMIGVLVSFKPLWLTPMAFVLLLERRWKPLVALGTGMLPVVALSLVELEVLHAWLAHLSAIADHNPYITVWGVQPWVAASMTLLLGVAGVTILTRYREDRDAWLFACILILVWPRLVTYSFALTLPIVLMLIERKGLRGLLFSLPVLGPLPWLAREAQWLPDHQIEGILLLVWTVSVGVWLTVQIMREER